MGAPKSISVKKGKSGRMKDTQLVGRVARGYGPQVDQSMERQGWNRINGPGATMVVKVG